MARAIAHHERLLARWSELGGDRAEGEALGALRALGIEGVALEIPTRALSGGQRKLVALAACLVRRPDVLLLDEPEAHLDMARRERLGALLNDFEGAVVMISHDRHLLDETVAEIAELDRGTIRVWPGAYSAYALARKLELERQQQKWVTQQKEIARLEEAVRRFRHWAHIRVNERAAKQARVKQMQIDRMEKIERPVLERRRMALALRSGTRGGQRVLALGGVDVSLGSEPILLDVELVIGRGERVGVVGPNGGGKTTLLRTLTGELVPDAGERWAGDGIAIGYLSQAAGSLPDELPVIDALRAGRSLTEEAAVRVADGLPVRLRAVPAAGVDAVGRRAHAARVPVPDARRAELPRARRAHQPPRHRLDRGPRGCAGGLRRHGRGRLARPLLPRPDRRPDRVRGRRRGTGLRGRLVVERGDRA